ncbi:Hypothetical predicted protein [Olea europaea subsp. europaea]|uniref:Uncharacterized protein n=1 Tax=Olea europaea subsp. europaea TaxID=158383 RepID=A0A8S0VMS2_OLEEU|nr:Hypothetical predicted protein [Olea europaea subsp. europaea]
MAGSHAVATAWGGSIIDGSGDGLGGLAGSCDERAVSFWMLPLALEKFTTARTDGEAAGGKSRRRILRRIQDMHLYHSNQRHDLADTGMIVHAYVAITKRSFRHLTSDPKALMAGLFLRTLQRSQKRFSSDFPQHAGDRCCPDSVPSRERRFSRIPSLTKHSGQYNRSAIGSCGAKMIDYPPAADAIGSPRLRASGCQLTVWSTARGLGMPFVISSPAASRHQMQLALFRSR